VVGPFFNDFVKMRIFFITKNLILIFKLSIRESFYHTKRDFTVILVFLIVKEKEKIYKYVYKKKCIVSVNVSILNG
jgi:hypothetical protein